MGSGTEGEKYYISIRRHRRFGARSETYYIITPRIRISAQKLKVLYHHLLVIDFWSRKFSELEFPPPLLVIGFWYQEIKILCHHPSSSNSGANIKKMT